MGRSLSIMKVLLCILNSTINKAGPTSPSFVAPGLLWSGHATKRDLGKLQMAQDRAARLAFGCTQRANINNKHVNLSRLKVAERLTSSLLVFVRGIDVECTKLSICTTGTHLVHP